MSEQPHDADILLQSVDEARALLGPLDGNVRLIRDLHGVNVLSREGSLRLIGEANEVAFVRGVLEESLVRLRRGEEVSSTEIGDRLKVLDSSAVVAAAGQDGRSALGGPSRVRARSAGQVRYLRDLEQHDVVFAIGPAGTGKTYLAVAAAVQAAKAGAVRRIVLVRPAVEAGEKLGFLPGDFQAKVDPYMRPLYDALQDLLEPGQRERYLASDVIEICPLAYMRGRTLNHAYVILDEAQNTTIPQMMMFLTRLGEGSKMVVTGDPSQVDLPVGVKSGLADAVRRLKDVDGVKITRLRREDIVRHAVVQRIIDAYGHGAATSPREHP
ncbi:MAG: PhoH family protein [Planctomycetes bacterium]|nr:PhoH family protein [Planctomycetota bacterium]